jgi:glyceraldehyde-3-phosphate dehydrogenase/erythrose-4-phosphate dehydrogenase
MASKVPINGLGRIGRAALKLALEQPQLELVAVNEIGSLENMVYLLKYDTVYGRYDRQVDAVDGKLASYFPNSGTPPFWLVVERGQVTRIAQQYLP